METTESNIAVEVESKKGETTVCSRLNNHCVSECCIDGKCVDSFRCTPVEAPRRRGGGGGRRVSRGGGGSSSGGGGGWPTWAFVLLAVGVVIIVIIIFIYVFYIIAKSGGFFK